MNNTTILVIRVNGRLIAFDIDSVIETMRPVAVETVQGMPSFVRGLSVIRGLSVPVVELAVLLGDEASTSAGRFVLLRVGERRVAVAVSEVLAIRRIEEGSHRAFPPLLEESLSGLVAAIEQRDREFLLVLRASRLVPDEVWRQLESNERGA